MPFGQRTMPDSGPELPDSGPAQSLPPAAHFSRPLFGPLLVLRVLTLSFYPATRGLRGEVTAVISGIPPRNGTAWPLLHSLSTLIVDRGQEVSMSRPHRGGGYQKSRRTMLPSAAARK